MSILSNFLDAIKPKIEEQEQNPEETLEADGKQDEDKEIITDSGKQDEEVDNKQEENPVDEAKELTVDDIPEDLLKELYSKFKEAEMTEEEKQEKEINTKLINSLKTYSALELKNTLAKSELPLECEVLFKSESYISGQTIDTERLTKDVENIKSVINKITDAKVDKIKKELFADKEPIITKKPVATAKNKDFDTAFNNLFNSLK